MLLSKSACISSPHKHTLEAISNRLAQRLQGGNGTTNLQMNGQPVLPTATEAKEIPKLIIRETHDFKHFTRPVTN